MRKHPDRSEQPRRAGERVQKIAKKKMLFRWYAIGMRRDRALEDLDVPIGKNFSEVVVGSPVPQPEFQNRPGEVPDLADRPFQYVLLRHQAADRAVQTAQDSKVRLEGIDNTATVTSRGLLGAMGLAKLGVGVFQTRRQLPHDFDGDLGEFGH